MFKPDIKVFKDGRWQGYDELENEARKHVNEELPLLIGTVVSVTDDKGLNKEIGTIVHKQHVFGAGYKYLVKFDRDNTGWSHNLWTDFTSDRLDLLWCSPYNVTEVN